MSKNPNNLHSKPAVKHEFSDVEKLGLSVSTRYSKIVHPDIESRDIYSSLYAIHQQINEYSPTCDFEGFDWFVSTIAIVFELDIDQTIFTLKEFSRWEMSMYFWPRCVAVDKNYLSSFEIVHTYCHIVDSILEAELPLVYSALTLSGITSSQ
ncbi:hypothetical protein HK096_011025, partial [Nowakowskiella sp. JEL0078]